MWKQNILLYFNINFIFNLHEAHMYLIDWHVLLFKGNQNNLVLIDEGGHVGWRCLEGQQLSHILRYNYPFWINNTRNRK